MGEMDAGLYRLFESRFEERLDAPFIEVPAGKTYTYREAAAFAGAYSAVLHDFGVRKADRVAVQVRKSAQNVFLYLAVLRCGAVFVPLNTAYRPSENSYFLEDLGPKVWVVPPEAQGEAHAVAGSAATPHILTLGTADDGTLSELAEKHPGTGMAREIRAPRTMARQSATRIAISANDLASIVYTSGTTGRPKGAMLTHANLASNAQALHEVWRFRPNDVLLHALPLFHIHGLFVALHCALLSGAKILFLPEFDLSEVIAALPRATVMMGVPTFYTRLLARSEFTGELVRNMRLFTSGSAPLLAQTHVQFAQRTGHRIVERYGLTETGILTSNILDGDREPGTVGFALPGVELRLVDGAGRAVGPNVVGVVEARGAGISAGYWNAPEKTAQSRHEGFFHTGDLATRDEKGCVRIVGRAKDLIISGGFNVYPKEVETVIDAIEGVLESAIIGPPHPDFGEAVVAVVVKKSAAETVTEHGIISRMKLEVANFKVPKRVFFVDELPRNAMGKVQKNLLVERFRAVFNPE